MARSVPLVVDLCKREMEKSLNLVSDLNCIFNYLSSPPTDQHTHRAYMLNSFSAWLYWISFVVFPRRTFNQFQFHPERLSPRERKRKAQLMMAFLMPHKSTKRKRNRFQLTVWMCLDSRQQFISMAISCGMWGDGNVPGWFPEWLSSLCAKRLLRSIELFTKQTTEEKFSRNESKYFRFVFFSWILRWNFFRAD